MWKTVSAVFLLTLAACEQTPSGPCQLVRVADLPIQIVNGTIMIDALLNGAPARLQFDTGSNVSVITREAARRLHLRTIVGRVGDVSGIGGERSAGVVVADTFQLGQLHGEHAPFLAADVFGQQPNARDGLLSTDFLSKYDIDLDLADRKIILFVPLQDCRGRQVSVVLDAPIYAVPLIQPPISHNFEQLPADDRRAPRVMVEVGGRDLKAAIDTGAINTLIFRNAAARDGLDIDALLRGAKPVIRGVGPRAVRAVAHILPQIAIGDIVVHNIPVVIADQHGTEDIDMLLGLEFMSRVHVWISNSSQAVVMQFPPKPSPP